MLDGCAGSNHVTEELVVGVLNHAKSLRIGTEDPRFPIVKFERWVHPKFVHGLASSTQKSGRNQGQTARRQGSGLRH